MINIEVGESNFSNPSEMWDGKILTFDSYIVTCFLVKSYTRAHLNQLIWKSNGNRKKKQRKKQHEAEVEPELSREGAGGGCSSCTRTERLTSSSDT